MKNKQHVNMFLVDDDPMYLKTLENNFLKESAHYDAKVTTFLTGDDCLHNMHLKPDVIVLDYYLDGFSAKAINGLEILKKIKSANEHTEVIMLSGQDKIDIAVNSMKYGAFDYIVKNESAFVRTQNVINNIINNKKLKSEAKEQRIWLTVLSVFIFILVSSILIIGFFAPGSFKPFN